MGDDQVRYVLTLTEDTLAAIETSVMAKVPAHKMKLVDLNQCSLTGHSDEEQRDFDQVIESLTGPTEEEFNRKFQELVTNAAKAANSGKDDEAKQAAMTMLLMAGAKALKNPSRDVALANEASSCESDGNWAKAEALRRKLLRIHKRSGCAGMIVKAQLDLSRLLRLLGQLDEAWRYARAASKSARQADIAPLTVMALENEAQCALERKTISLARKAVEKAMQLLQPERIYNQMRMRLLTLRAQCLLETGDAAGAERELNTAGDLEFNSAFSRMAGAMIGRARRRTVLAEVQIQRGRLAKAAISLNQAVALLREAGRGCCTQSPYLQEAQARVLDRLSETSRQLGKMTAARKAMHEAITLRKQAQR